MKYAKHLTISFLGIFLMWTQVSAQANHQPGTALYLQNEMGFSAAQLDAKHKTEDRDPFEMADSLSVNDPTGDVLDRFGARANVRAGWADISHIQFEKNNTDQTWDITIQTGEPIPEQPPHKVQFWILTDQDKNNENNAQLGIRGQTDQSHMAKYDSENGWATDYRWYNTETDFWALDKQTTAELSLTEDGNILYSIPFSEMPKDTDPEWRVVAAVEKGGTTQIDVAPGIGFPAPKNTSDGSSNENHQDTKEHSAIMEWWKNLEITAAHGILILSLVLSVVYLGWVMKKTETQSK